jgi:hypothetical protein
VPWASAARIRTATARTLLARSTAVLHSGEATSATPLPVLWVGDTAVVMPLTPAPAGRLSDQATAPTKTRDKGSNPLGSSFSIHGTADQVDPVLESAVCIDQNPPPPPENQLIFLGRYWLTSSPPAGFPSTCPTQETDTTPLCRFEVIVQDNDRNLAPSPGDFFSIKLSTVTASCADPIPDPTCSQLPGVAVFYARAGYLASGNLTVD